MPRVRFVLTALGKVIGKVAAFLLQLLPPMSVSVVTWLHPQRHGWGRTSVALGIMKIHRWPWALSHLWVPTARLLSISVLTVILPAACNIQGWEVVQVSFSWVSSTTAPREFTPDPPQPQYPLSVSPGDFYSGLL